MARVEQPKSPVLLDFIGLQPHWPIQQYPITVRITSIQAIMPALSLSDYPVHQASCFFSGGAGIGKSCKSDFQGAGQPPANPPSTPECKQTPLQTTNGICQIGSQANQIVCKTGLQSQVCHLADLSDISCSTVVHQLIYSRNRSRITPTETC